MMELPKNESGQTEYHRAAEDDGMRRMTPREEEANAEQVERRELDEESWIQRKIAKEHELTLAA